MRQKPTVLSREIVASSRLFRVEAVQLRFSNGNERTYERLVGRGNGYGAVMIVATPSMPCWWRNTAAAPMNTSCRCPRA